jgi:hypothetical protein
MAPRRPRASSNANQNPVTKNGPRRPDSTVPAFGGALIDPETRYEHNLKVVRRRDQSIIRIFDQFSHVVVYEHDQESKKWQKKGYEGAMFLFERFVYSWNRVIGTERMFPQAAGTPLWILYS